ncbi:MULTISPECIES: hypothetical protein [unclassified Colwellia]|uniref:hypothetical protein n=1 Tax=unclassified Colwellia TaxID=196834 RepID=UPI0015F5A88C|nr:MULTISPECIES: hypothetical protein [unclassified Colwellia]MBA6224629.1 hypothetical protein [Colwellia sp. MB3u-45]MBA6268059.1 hypothetical protein [Colwellia sp. MB3u-43]MBA6288784.1 hypothetical protein [Colwellia sp. MB3u-4]MBA6297061.1 hypothetical protein [Colwellia sp. MB02u-9]MBA6322511.1 hypothetical protein [Colwellia sp. MB02u-19]
METIVEDKYSIASRSNILQVEAFGPFNAHVTEKYIKDMYGACEQFSGQPWGLLIAFYGNSVFSPEAEDALIKVNKYRVKHGLIANASVLIDSSTADIQQLQLGRIYQACNITFYVFSDLDSAKSWLEQYLQQH